MDVSPLPLYEVGKTQEGGLNCVLKVKIFSQIKTI
jgi:hypothetical protein